MQLYSSPISPYASRVRIQVKHKQLPVEIVPPPGGMGSDAVRAKNPIGKIPVLDLGDAAISESWAIMEFLEDRHPQPAMRPADEIERARLRALVRFVDLQLAPAMFPMFLALRGKADADAVSAALANLVTQLATLDRLLADRRQGFDLGDAALLPIVWYAQVLARHFGNPDCLAEVPAVRAWWDRSRAVPAAAEVLGEMDAGLRAALPALFGDPAS